MTDSSLLGTGSGGVMEPARVPGHGSVPAPVARAWLREAGEGAVWLRRLFTSPQGRDLVAMDSRRRVFTGLLRRMLVLRDDVCVTPWCDAPIVQLDHAAPAREGGATDFGNGSGVCVRCHQVKEAPGWSVTVIRPGPGATPHRSAGASSSVTVRVPRKRRPSATGTSLPTRARSREVEVRTPTGRTFRVQSPPLTGWGWRPPPPRSRGAPAADGTASALERHLASLLRDAA